MYSKLPFVYMFLLMMGMGTIFSISSLHWLMIWVGLEMNLIGFLPLLVYHKKLVESESAVKYFVVQALGSSLLIFGSLLAYSISFSWEVSDMYGLNLIGLAVMVSGLFIKLGVFPFHMWLPSVMSGMSWFSCMLVATWQKIAPLFLFMVIMETSSSYWLGLVVCLLSVGSALIGGIGGINQTQVRGLLAYSSVGHLGWILFSLMHGESVMKFYFVVYILVSICLFLSLWFLDMGYMKDLSMLKSFNLSGLSVIFMLLSLGGLPPLLGFIPKFLVINISVMSPYFLCLFLMILGSVMSLYYYLSLFFSVLLSLLKEINSVSLKDWLSMFLVSILLFNILGGIFMMSINFLNMY